MTTLITAIGWAGAASLLVAYLLLLRHRTRADGSVYLSLNFAGSAALAISAGVAHAWPSSTLNLLWLIIGLGPMARLVSRQVTGRLVRRRVTDRAAWMSVTGNGALGHPKHDGEPDHDGEPECQPAEKAARDAINARERGTTLQGLANSS